MNWPVSLLLLAGAAFVLIAAIGVVRLPDALCRMHAATKAGAFGAALLLIGAATHFRTTDTAVKAALAIAFFYVTAPISGHLLGRAAYRRRDGATRLSVDEWRQPSELP
jgi:multicomponent Na+:H+ antiporter subunit G